MPAFTPRMRIAYAAAFLFLACIAVLVVGPLPVWLTSGDYVVTTVINGEVHTTPDTAARMQAVNAARGSLVTLLVGAITGLGLLGGFLMTIRNLRLTQQNLELTASRDRETQALALQGHVTDRYSKAVAQLDFTDATLRGARFSTEIFSEVLGGVDFEGVRLDGAHVEGADFAQARNLTPGRLDAAHRDEATKPPRFMGDESQPTPTS